jgi:signal transduction histidine kinase
MSEVGMLARIDRALVRTFEGGPTAVGRRRARFARLASCVAVSLTGVGLIIPNLAPSLAGGQPLVATGLSVVGVLVCLGLVAAGPLLYRSGFSTPNAVRIAIWNFLGLVVLGLILLGHGVYRGPPGTASPPDVLAAGNVLAISAAAHVIIGVHDARRVRAEQLAREREKFAVLSRVLRHNLRNDATVLIGHADNLARAVDDPTLVSATEALQERSRRMGNLADKTKEMVGALDRRTDPNSRANVRSVVERAVDRVDAGDVEIDVPEDLWLWADHAVDTALAELVENAVEHGGPTVRVTVEADGDRVRLRVADDGPGVPDAERAVVAGETVARSIAEAGGGRLVFESDADRSVVALVHGRASPPASGAGADATTA